MLSQEAVYAHILGFYPQEGKHYTNPLRMDRSPGMFFRKKGNYLRLYDNGWGTFNNVNCFDLWNIWKRSQRICCQDDFRLVRDEISREMNANKVVIGACLEDDWQYELTFKAKAWTYEDLKWWLSFGITKSQLEADDVYSVESYEFNVRGSDIRYRIVPQDLCFGYIVENKKIHIYRPLQSRDSGKKFRTTVVREMVSFPERKSDTLFIGGSYKDSRVMYNCTEYNVKARMAEGTLPTEHEMRKMCNKYKHVVFIGDDDEAGRRHLLTIKEKLAPLNLHNIHYSIPQVSVAGVKDVAEYYSVKGEFSTAKLLKEWEKFSI